VALWYHCGNGWVKTLAFARSRLAADAYLCCPGPSLAQVDGSALGGPGRMVFAVTTAYPAIRPDVWVGTDVPECYDRQLWAEPFIKIVRGNYGHLLCQGRPLRDFPNVYFADVDNAPFLEILDRRDHGAVFVWNHNTFTTALHLAIWMGAQRIFLVGCDFGGAADYHDGRELAEAHRAENRQLYANLVNDLRRLAPAARARGIEVVSATPGSPVNAFLPSVTVADALALSKSHVPDASAPLLHAADAELCQWQGSPSHDRGVVVAALDTQLEWLLPWWFEGFRKHNDLPVAFADYGMSTAMHEWCAQRGLIVDLTDVPVPLLSFRKPFAILRAPFREMLCLEPDCEVRGPVAPLLDRCRDSRLGLAPAAPGRSVAAEAEGGWFAMCPPDTPMWDAGIVAVCHGHSVIADWAAETLAGKHAYRGDNEALALVVARGGYGVDQIPPTLAFNRHRGPDNGATVFHWTGPRGKVLLKQRLEAEAATSASSVAPAPEWAWIPSDEFGVMVPVCAGQEDLVPWWWWAYTRHNRWPVAFSDFGMDDPTRRWCEAHGRVVRHGGPSDVTGWFRKPFALLQSPFKRTAWIDLDCVVRADLARIASLGSARLTLGRDWSYPAALRKRLPFEGPCWSSAFLVVNHGDPLVVEWAKAVAERHAMFRGDQEILSALLNDGRKDALTEVPLELVRSRQEGEDDDLVAVHWSGPGGKGAIRRAWWAIQAGVCADMRAAFGRGWGSAEPTADRGVIVGFDQPQEWLLEWWWSAYAAHNGLPVLFVDFGMSPAARSWCAERGILSEPTAIDCYGWFKKPLALLKSPFRRAIWLDADCEVRGPVDRLFGFCADGGIGLTFDRGTPEPFRESMPSDAPIYNSGVVVFNHGDPVMPQWASMTLALRSDRPGDTRYGQPGDQETLALALRRYAQGRVREIPMELVRLRLSDGDGSALVMHWTGPTGKQHIQEVMAQSRAKEVKAEVGP